MKTISIFLALINSLLAGLLILFNLSGSGLHQTEVWWFLSKVVVSITVIALGIATWLASTRGTNIELLFIGSVFLTVLGAVTIVWTFHLAILSGDMEYYMVGYGASLMAQGVSSLLGFAGDAGSVAV